MTTWLRQKGAIGVSIIAVAIAAGCSSRSASSLTPALTSMRLETYNTYVFRCEGNYRFAITSYGDSVALQYGTRSASLQREAAEAEDARRSYSAGGITFAHTGLQGDLRTPGSSRAGCEGRRADGPWEKAGMLGYDYRGLGQEPGWFVEIAADHMRVALDYATDPIYSGAPAPVFDVDGVTSYRAQVDERDMMVTITEQACEDTMSGEPYPTAVTLRVGESTYSGCGGFLTDEFGPVLDGPRWALAEISGLRVEPLVDGRGTYLMFNVARGQVAGFTGCNEIVGMITLFGDELRFREPIAMTRLSCMDGIAANRERSFLSALQRTSRYTVEDETLTLYAGNQAVARFRAQR